MEHCISQNRLNNAAVTNSSQILAAYNNKDLLFSCAICFLCFHTWEWGLCSSESLQDLNSWSSPYHKPVWSLCQTDRRSLALSAKMLLFEGNLFPSVHKSLTVTSHMSPHTVRGPEKCNLPCVWQQGKPEISGKQQ